MATFLSPPLLCFTALAFLATSILGTLGNLLVALALLTSDKRSATTLLMTNLALCPLPICIVCLPFLVVTCFMKAYSTMDIDPLIMKTIFVIFSICSQVELHTIATLAFNRLCAVSFPTFFKIFMNQINSMVSIVIFLWIYSIVLWIPVTLGVWGRMEVNADEYFVHLTDETRYKVYILTAICFILPFMVAVICHIIMYVKFRQTRSSEGNETVMRPWKNHVTKTMSIIFLLLIICSVPHIIIHILKRFDSWPRAWTLIHVLYFSRFCLNPIVYVYTSKRYRKDCIKFLRKIKILPGQRYGKSKPRIPYNVSSNNETTDNL